MQIFPLFLLYVSETRDLKALLFKGGFGWIVNNDPTGAAAHASSSLVNSSKQSAIRKGGTLLFYMAPKLAYCVRSPT